MTHEIGMHYFCRAMFKPLFTVFLYLALHLYLTEVVSKESHLQYMLSVSPPFPGYCHTCACVGAYIHVNYIKLVVLLHVFHKANCCCVLNQYR